MQCQIDQFCGQKKLRVYGQSGMLSITAETYCTFVVVLVSIVKIAFPFSAGTTALDE